MLPGWGLGGAKRKTWRSWAPTPLVSRRFLVLCVHVCACVCPPPLSLNTSQLREQEQTGPGKEITTAVLGPTLRFHKGSRSVSDGTLSRGLGAAGGRGGA